MEFIRLDPIHPITDCDRHSRRLSFNCVVLDYVTVGRTKRLIYSTVAEPYWFRISNEYVTQRLNTRSFVISCLPNSTKREEKQMRTATNTSTVYHLDSGTRSTGWGEQNTISRWRKKIPNRNTETDDEKTHDTQKSVCVFKRAFQVKFQKNENKAIWSSSIDRNIQSFNKCVTKQ